MLSTTGLTSTTLRKDAYKTSLINIIFHFHNGRTSHEVAAFLLALKIKSPQNQPAKVHPTPLLSPALRKC